MILSTKAKNILDNVLHAAGAVCGFVAANQAGIIAAFPAQDQPVVAIVASGVGVLGGDVVSDIIGMVDSGTSPTLAGIAQDLKSLWPAAKPLLQAAAASGKLMSEETAVVNAAIPFIDKAATA